MNKIKIKSINLIGKNYYKVILYPVLNLYSEYIANLIRKLLFLDTYSFEITEIKIGNNLHEYDSIPGIKEDVFNLIFNMKNIIFKLKNNCKKLIFNFKISNKKIFYAKDIKIDNNSLEILNFNHVICHLYDDIILNIKIKIEKGKNSNINYNIKKSEFGGIILDNYFCPIKRISYLIKKNKYNFINNFEKIIFNIKTNGVINIKKAIEKCIGNFLYFFSNFKILKLKKKNIFNNYKVFLPITKINASIKLLKIFNIFKFNYLGDLIYNIKNIINSNNFNIKYINEIKNILNYYNFNFKTKINNWKKILKVYLFKFK